MKLLQKLLLVIASAGLMVFAPAGGVTHDMGIVSPTLKQQADFHSTSSFADIFGFTPGMKYQTVLAGVANNAPDGTMVRIVDGKVGDGIQISVATDTEPDGWMLLLCGLTVVAFIARRKTDLVSG